MVLHLLLSPVMNGLVKDNVLGPRRYSLATYTG